MEKITDVLKELEKVTCRELAGYFDLIAPEMLARLMVLEREGLSGEEFRVQALECGHRGLTSLVDELGRCHEECPVEEGI